MSSDGSEGAVGEGTDAPDDDPPAGSRRAGDPPEVDPAEEDPSVGRQSGEGGPDEDRPDEDLSDDGAESSPEDEPPAVGEYTWADYMEEYGYGGVVDDLYGPLEEDGSGGILGGSGGSDGTRPVPSGEDWDRVPFDPAVHLGFHPDDLDERTVEAATDGELLFRAFREWIETTPVVKDEYTWEHYKWEYHYGEDGEIPHDEDGEKVEFDQGQALGLDPEKLENVLSWGETAAEFMLDLEDERTVDVDPEVDEDEFFSTVEGRTTIANRYDLEKAVDMEKKRHFREVDRYWVNKPYSFVVIFHSEKENERKYYLVEPYSTVVEDDLRAFFTEKLRTAIKYANDDVVVEGAEAERLGVIERETRRLLERYGLYDDPVAGERSLIERIMEWLGRAEPPEPPEGIDGLSARPEPALLAEDSDTLTQYQVEKLLYVLKRDFIGYERIDGIKHDINVEDISCDGYNSPVFVYHTDYEQLISNVHHGRQRLDDFVVKLAQRSGKGISKRQPQVDATLPDGSRAQLTLGREVSDHGTNYTIRQFKDVPFTPIDLINWHTFSLDEMAFLWLCIENNKSLIFAGGTASGKTTSLNAVSLFIPSNSKIVSIEDTREVELPQRNWIASVTRPSFADDEAGDIDEFDLLEAALRQRPDYIVMGEIRGEEGRTLFQVMSTGHTTYTTFHADSVSEVLKRFTTEPINVSKTLFTALDLVSIQTSTRVQGRKVRRNKALTEINHYDAENDEINVQDVFQWRPEDDAYDQIGDSNTLDEIRFDRGWTHAELESELFTRQVILAYLIECGLNEYAQVAATAQAFINDPDTILTLIANDQLEAALDDLRGMESVLIDVDPEKEKMVPRPDPGDDVLDEVRAILDEADERLLDDYRGEDAPDIALALKGDLADDVLVDAPADGEALPDVDGGADADDGTPAGIDDVATETDDGSAGMDGTTADDDGRAAGGETATGDGETTADDGPTVGGEPADDGDSSTGLADEDIDWTDDGTGSPADYDRAVDAGRPLRTDDGDGPLDDHDDGDGRAGDHGDGGGPEDGQDEDPVGGSSDETPWLGTVPDEPDAATDSADGEADGAAGSSDSVGPDDEDESDDSDEREDVAEPDDDDLGDDESDDDLDDDLCDDESDDAEFGGFEFDDTEGR